MAAIDNCDDFVVVTHTEDEAAVICEDSYNLVRVWTATDHAGNQASYEQIITIQDTTDPVVSILPSDTTQDCSSPLFSTGPKFTWWDNCDDDVSAVPGLTPGGDDCKRWLSRTLLLTDDCGNDLLVSWTESVIDDTPPSVSGGKHCVYQRSHDGYGSPHLYAEFDLDDLVSFKDDCDARPTISGVWFNRTTDDRTNIFDSVSFQPTSSLAHDCSRPSNDKFRATVATRPGAQYVFTISAIVSTCANRPVTPSGVIQIGDGNGVFDLIRDPMTVSPLANGLFTSYSLHFTAEGDTVTIQLDSSYGVWFHTATSGSYYGNGQLSNRQGGPILKTQHGEGLWMVTSDEAGGAETTSEVGLDCTGVKDPSGLTKPCSSIEIASQTGIEAYTALPTLVNDRFCYQSTTKSWRSLAHYTFSDGSIYWTVTDFAPQNPSSYNWMSLDSEVAKRLGRDATATHDSVLQALVGAGTILSYWKETTSFSPVQASKGVSCPNPDAVSFRQCQGACYYLGFATALHYSDAGMNAELAGQCRCAQSCVPAAHFVAPRQYTLYKWFEGFYYDPTANTVRILAHTDQPDGISVNMWVSVQDHCGLVGTGLVEFWVAPSLDAAAAQGRTCVESTVDPGEYVSPFAFTSDDHIIPHQIAEADSGDGGCAGTFFLTLVSNRGVIVHFCDDGVPSFGPPGSEIAQTWDALNDWEALQTDLLYCDVFDPNSIAPTFSALNDGAQITTCPGFH